MSEPWEGEGSGGENDWGDESVEKDPEEDGLFEPIESDEDEDDDFDADDEQ